MRIFNRDYHQPKRFLPGTRRARTPAETMQDFGRHMPQVGITRLADVTGLDVIGIPVVQAIRPNSRSLSVSQGKGADIESAKASAMMEAIELWHAENIEIPCLHGSYNALRRRHNLVDLHRLPLVKGGRVRLEQQQSWLPGWDLLSETQVWVPFEFVSMNTVGVTQATMTFLGTSNGLASGNHLLEAIEHALCEVIERDAHALSCAQGTVDSPGAKIDVDTIEEPSLRELIDLCRAAGMELAVLEMASEVGVATFRAGLLEREERGQWNRLGAEWGCGTHLSPVVALSRAVTEAAQARLTVIAASRDDNPPAVYAGSQGIWSAQAFRDSIFTAPGVLPFLPHARQPETDSFEGDLEVMLTALRAADVDQVVVVDLTKPDIGIPVVKVIVPEFESAPFVAGYVEGRRARAARKGKS
ncbi:YcaO-like family protein [Streptomyces sp. NBC_00425]|uniref:YcaO-like family protein n=1 Tax=Streptomyces sp. NBC_00425 TaxID=2975740 RepID=UPI002E1E1DAA